MKVTLPTLDRATLEWATLDWPALNRRPLSIVSIAVLGTLLLGACSGIETIPDPTDAFAAKQYTTYAWRSEPPSRAAASKDILQQKSPAVRAGLEKKMAQLGYTLVDRSEAEFLVEYLAASGYNEGQLVHQSDNTVLYGSSVNRGIDGASIDNAYALGGVVETGNLILVFIDAETTETLWQVRITMVVHDTNRVDQDQVRKAVVKGLETVPPVS